MTENEIVFQRKRGRKRKSEDAESSVCSVSTTNSNVSSRKYKKFKQDELVKRLKAEYKETLKRKLIDDQNEDLKTQETECKLEKERAEYKKIKAEIRFGFNESCYSYRFYYLPDYRSSLIADVNVPRKNIINLFRPYLIFKTHLQDGSETCENWDDIYELSKKRFSTPFISILSDDDSINSFWKRLNIDLDKIKCICIGEPLVVEHVREGTRVCGRCGLILESSINGIEKNAFDRTSFAGSTANVYQRVSTQSSTLKDGKLRVNRTNLSSSYDCKNNFRDILTRLQAKESLVIPEHVITQVAERLASASISSGDITHHLLRRCLRRMGHNKYLSNVAQLKWKLTGIPPKQMTAEQETTLCVAFEEFLEIYPGIRPQGRKSLLNYCVLGYKMCEMFGYTEFLEFFPLLKSSKKLSFQLQIWKKACEIKNWPFHNTAI